MNPDSTTEAQLTIRPAISEDAALVFQFIRELADYAKLSHEITTDEAALREKLFGPHPAAEVWLAYVAGAPAGFAVFFQNFSTFLGRPGIYLEDLFVRETFRRRGVGRALLQHLAREANRRGCGRFEWAVLDWNEHAQTFYRSMGAEVLGQWRLCRLSGEALSRFGV